MTYPQSTIAMAVLSAERVGIAVAQNWFVPFLAAAMAIYHITVDDSEKMPTNKKRLYKEYDFIIIGEDLIRL